MGSSRSITAPGAVVARARVRADPTRTRRTTSSEGADKTPSDQTHARSRERAHASNQRERPRPILPPAASIFCIFFPFSFCFFFCEIEKDERVVDTRQRGTTCVDLQ